MKQLEFGWIPFGKLYVLDAIYSLSINNFKSSEDGYYKFTLIPLICGLKRNTVCGTGLPEKDGVSHSLQLLLMADGAAGLNGAHAVLLSKKEGPGNAITPPQ